jgi:hypothetical protein
MLEDNGREDSIDRECESSEKEIKLAAVIS